VGEPFRNKEKRESSGTSMRDEQNCTEVSKNRRQLVYSTVGRDVKLNSVTSQKKVFVVLVETVKDLVNK
jgi:hypothetical protein